MIKFHTFSLFALGILRSICEYVHVKSPLLQKVLHMNVSDFARERFSHSSTKNSFSWAVFKESRAHCSRSLIYQHVHRTSAKCVHTNCQYAKANVYLSLMRTKSRRK